MVFKQCCYNKNFLKSSGPKAFTFLNNIYKDQADQKFHLQALYFQTSI